MHVLVDLQELAHLRSGDQDDYGFFMSLSDLGFCGVGKHSHKKATILVSYTGGSNLSCAYVSEGADLTSTMVLGIGIFRDFSIDATSEVSSLR